jgi:glycine/serine hydroxymethyltransferase
MMEIGDLIARALDARNDPAVLAQVRDEVQTLTRRFPLRGKQAGDW